MQRIFTIRKGWHLSLPRLPKYWFKKTVVLYINYDFSDATYLLENRVDQWDWNKVIGIGTDWIPSRNSVMLGHRFNFITGNHEACIFFNNDTKHEVYQITPGATGNCVLTLDNGRIGGRMGSNRLNIIEVPRKLPFRMAYRIQSWFGGNQKAPTTVKYHVQVTH